jgi:hypothetical protein
MTFARTVAILLSALIGAGAAPAEEPRTCRIDAEGGVLQWRGEGQERKVENLLAQLTELDSLLGAGEAAIELRTLLGERLLGPGAGSDVWILELDSALTPPVAVLSTLIVPGESGPAFAHHRIDFRWSGRAPAESNPPNPGPLVLSAPFARDVAPASDDPDTLRAALGRAVRQVRLIPRNERDAGTLAATLESLRPAIWWFRGDSDQLHHLSGAFDHLPALVVWTLPSRPGAARPQLSRETFAGVQGVLVQMRRAPESRTAPMFRRFADGIARGLALGDALREAQTHALSKGLPIGLAGSVVVVGQGTVRVRTSRALWWKRLQH